MKQMCKDLRFKMFAGPGVSITAVKASGVRIQTREYGELIDFESGCWAAVLGHSRKEVTQALIENVEVLLHTHQFFDTEHPGALVKELIAAAALKSDYRGTFISSGSEAVSLAVSLAELVTGRPRKLSFSISYLGSTPELHLPRDPARWTDLDIRECLSCTRQSGCRECGKHSSIDFSQLAAFVFEPGNSGGVVLFPPDKLIRFLAEETRAAGGLVIANEVTTGFGRTGKWFGFQHYGVFDSEANEPDFISLGKGLGNGYPISGVLVKLRLAEIIEAAGFRYVQSHIDDPLGCIVARKVIEVMQNENVIEHGAKMGEYLRTKLAETAARIGGIKEIRGRGMMNVVELDNSHKAKEVFKGLLEKGFFTGYSEIYNYIHLYAPLIITEEDIDALCHSLELILESDPAVQTD